MEIRELAQRVLFATTLQEKLAFPGALSDDRPGPVVLAPQSPGRPADLCFKAPGTTPSKIPAIRDLERSQQRGRLLHFFANHELLASELMALVLLRFPDAPAAFRRAVLQTLKDEQQHTQWYLRRMRECGVAFGEHPVSGYFWRAVSLMETPIDYVSRLSLTFEQANLDFARFFANAFAQVGDLESSRLLEHIYQDEIGHVACGLNWFRKWKDPEQSDWDAYRSYLSFPLSPQRAKGPVFNVAGRLAAGFDRGFIDQLSAFRQSRGRTPAVYWFNPFTEAHIAQGPGFTPNKHQQLLQEDLENLPQFLCRRDDVVLVNRPPATTFLKYLQEAGFVIPELVQLENGKLTPANSLNGRKLMELRPWAWGPDSLEVLGQLLPRLTSGRREPGSYFNAEIQKLYSKEWSASLLKTVLASVLQKGELRAADPDRLSWLCTEQELGTGVGTLSEVEAEIHAIRSRGHYKVIAKEALGVAGHNAIRLFEPELLDSQRLWIARALDNGRRVLLEPWLERVADFSIQFEMGARGLKLIGYAGLLTDWRGRYQGNWAQPAFQRRVCLDWPRFFPQVPDIAGKVLSLYSSISSLLAQKLEEAGYSGPVGIDAFVYKTSEGHCCLKPIVEINPRYTMGRLTLELMRNVAPGSTGTLRLINQKRVNADGFADFSSWSRTAVRRMPLRRQGEPVPRIRSGIILLSDPNRVQACLPVFTVCPGQAPLL